ncbi:ferritin-like domain-containing protein [Zunongwangia sp. F260]|uniref:Ferritin-like domain-containing protein n=1 Tax=Autumnicola lenta TaxID=3075593 RepID=A0ABU3CFT2_9FLAO|nr:ferritin-like domain-containing protein [Zunongwangia sp. F260]MDT0645214.1 ferritin-like domain-containing protein [Zunongwangia sp. F260]
MSIIKMLDEFTSENLTKKTSSRRELFSTFGSLGKKAAVAAVPFGLAGKSASASTFFQQRAHEEPFRLALTLEYLEAQFYMMALESGVLEGGSREEIAFMKISEHEDAHVALLQAVLEEAEVNTDSPSFDFTVGGMFDPFNENGDIETARAQVLALAQAFEDTGVRAYKGQAPMLMGTPWLEPALQIHSVEARHASEIRRIRGLKGWITGSERGAGMPEATQAVYDGEDVVTQGGVDLTTLDYGDSPIVGDVTAAVTQAFDEPITGETATAIASLFIVADDNGGEEDTEG